MFLFVEMLFLTTMTSVRAMPNMRSPSEDVEHVTVSEIVSEQTRIQRSDSGDCQFPPTLLFQFDVQGEKATLNLEKNVYLSRGIPIYITQNGQSYKEDLNDTKDFQDDWSFILDIAFFTRPSITLVQRSQEIAPKFTENESRNGNMEFTPDSGTTEAADLTIFSEFATYQDVVRGSSMLVFCQEDGTFKLHGSFRHGGELYTMSYSGYPEPSPVHFIQRSQDIKGSFRNDAIMPPDEVVDELLESTTMRSKVCQKMENSMNETDENIIELLFTVDKSVYQLFLEETGRHKAALAALEQYAVLLANEIDLYFYSVTMQDPSLIIKIYLAGVEVPERGSDVSWSTESRVVVDGVNHVDYSKIPGNVEKWRKEHNIKVQYDYVMALTRYDLVQFNSDITGPDKSYAVGVAYFGTMCRRNNDNSVSAVVVSSLKVAVTGAHELAHSLKVFHDGAASSKECSSTDMNIMSIEAMKPFNLTYAEAATKFSSCSVKSMKCFIYRKGDKNCMKQHSFSKSEFEAQKELPFPGTVYSLDQQCQLYRTVSSSSCVERLSESNCHAGFQCSTIDALPDGCNVTDLYLLVPFTGTPCGEPEDDKWCYRGLCRPRQAATTVQPPGTTKSTTVSPFCSKKCCIRKSNGKKKCCKGLKCCEVNFGRKLDCCTLCNQVSSGSTTVMTTPTTTSEQCYEGECCKRILIDGSKKKVCCTGKKCCKRSWGINTKCCKTCG